MGYEQLLCRLRPERYGSPDVEAFEVYRHRVNGLLPSWPDCPLRNWLYRHYAYAVSDYGWLRFDKMSFELVSWPGELIRRDVRTHKLDLVDRLGTRILSNSPSMRSWLQSFVLDHGTWPAPIIVLANTRALRSPRGEVYGQPYHLLEGHLRLGYLRTLLRANSVALVNSHAVWIVTLMGPRLGALPHP